MKIKIDDINRIHMIDEYKPYGSIIFDPYENRVGLYQDSGNPEIRTAFEHIEESAEFERQELVDGLREIIEILEGDYREYTL
ncbi:hypothetical protein HXW75_01950 [Tetragenococcus halophilus]|uniref:Uncharacterized protein n=2 Tax=Tetragenococcus halophilus TaxID=51669 RepID=A0AB35HM67_TETHA|nr:hypothetical protein [Tetragenococcus halophilus]